MMVFLTGVLLVDLFAFLTTIVIGLILIFKWRFTYWERISLPHLNPSVLFGDMKMFMLGRSTIGEQFREFYRTFKSKGHKHGGIYLGLQRFYVPIDPEIVKNIMQRDFDHFVNHGNYINEKADPLSAHLFNLENEKWRNMRIKLTPTFTSGKMKMMFQTMVDCSDGLKEIMNSSDTDHAPVDIKDILGRFTTDIISSVAFGLECNSLKDPNAEFRKYGKRVFQIDFREKIRLILILSLPHPVLRFLNVKMSKKDVERFFMKAVQDTVQYREKNKIYRKDFMHLLIQLKNRGSVADDEHVTDRHGKTDEKALTMNELSAQAFVFFLAGFETSSTTMTWALYELAMNSEVQDKLRREINTVLEKHDGQLTYDGVMEMRYMDQVINETLRMYPPLPILLRKCNRDYVVPDTNITIEKGISVGIPVLALHTDPEYYPNPEKFDPDRFSEENKNSRPAFTWLPFGEGPRACIGLRFGLLQSKVGLSALLKNHKVKLNTKTQQPVKLQPRSFITTAVGGIWLDVERIL